MINNTGGRSAGFYRDKWGEHQANESGGTPIKLERVPVSYDPSCAGEGVPIPEVIKKIVKDECEHVENLSKMKGSTLVKNDVQQDDLRDQMENHPMGAILLEAFELCLKKNNDYATKDDIFANFMLASTLNIDPSVGVAVRLSDKWQRFTKGVRTNWDMSIREEKMKDTMIDIINYAAIYYCLFTKEDNLELFP